MPNALTLKSVFVTSLIIGTSAVPALSTTSMDTQIDWRKIAIADVEAAYKVTAENHPGMVDTANPSFPKLLEKARVEALTLAKRVKTVGGYKAAVMRFRAVINDGHAGAYAEIPDSLIPRLRWPGFVAAWRGDAMYVFKSVQGGPVPGAKILMCDGVPLDTLTIRNVFDFSTGRGIAGDWWYRAGVLFVDAANPFITLPKRCVFETDGKRTQRTLTWNIVPDYYQTWKTESINGDVKPAIGMTEPSQGIYRIAMPTFDPEGTEVASYKKLYTDLASARPKLLSARAIILDLRHNLGGSSGWSQDVAGALWGQGRLERKVDYLFRNTAIAWRTTLSNEQKMRSFAEDEAKRGNPDSATGITQIADNLMKARNSKKMLFVEKIGADVVTAFPTTPAETIYGDPLAFTTPVYVIVPGQCASACLDAIDYFKLFTNTILIGAPSSADSTYMEVRYDTLPSTYGRVIIPMKVWVNRPRDSGKFFTPDIPVNDFDWSTANFLKRIEADLVKRKRS